MLCVALYILIVFITLEYNGKTPRIPRVSVYVCVCVCPPLTLMSEVQVDLLFCHTFKCESLLQGLEECTYIPISSMCNILIY